jgi:hypothetical protein
LFQPDLLRTDLDRIWIWILDLDFASTRIRIRSGGQSGARYCICSCVECEYLNRIPAIRVFAVRVTPIFTNKKHALNTLKMGPLLS